MEPSSNSGAPDIRKEKILAFIEKDIFVLNNYETVPFKNKNHAIECLIPYHIFQLTVDDIKFKGSDVEIDIKKELGAMKAKIGNMIKEHAFDTDGFTPQLLLYHEQRILNSIAQQSKPPEAVKKKKHTVDRKYFKIKLPRTEDYRASGVFNRLRIKINKND